MKNKLCLLLFVFAAGCLAAANGAEPPEVANEAVLSKQLAESLSQAIELQAKIEQVRAALSEINDTLEHEKKTAAILKTERKRRAEALKRAEKARVAAGQAEKERLVLASRLAELEQNLSGFRQNAPTGRLQSEITKERQALAEIEDKIKKYEKEQRAAGNAVVELKKQLNTLRKNSRLTSQNENEKKRLQSRLESLRRQRAGADAQMNAMEGKLKESEQSAAELRNMIAVAENQSEKDRETAESIAALEQELAKETARAQEAAERLEQQNGKLAAVEDEKGRLGKNLILAREKLGRDEKNINQLSAVKLQLAEQGKKRADAESELQQLEQKAGVLEKENEKLERQLIEVGKLILRNEEELQKSARVAEELSKETELAQEAAGRFREREEILKQLAAEKLALQAELGKAEQKLAQGKNEMRESEEKRRALIAAKEANAVFRKKERELAGLEKESRARINELEDKTRAIAMRSASLSLPAEQPAAVDRAGMVSPTDAFSSPEKAPDETGRSSNDILAAEQAVLSRARMDGSEVFGQDDGTVRRQDEQTGSRTRRKQLEKAEKHYALGIQKWDDDNLDGAIVEFKQAIRLNPDAAGAYYNISLAYLRQGQKKAACEYAYQAGDCYIRNKNPVQATRMTVLLTKIDPNSPFLPKLRNKIAAFAR
ncbi:MAG: tetratricopeptide repeat protein [Kiritimatiellae bacterium]|nr:tetratricopeptide repeat protein [Kiritimatiellia bacterium]